MPGRHVREFIECDKPPAEIFHDEFGVFMFAPVDGGSLFRQVLEFAMQTQPGRSYRVQGSTNLIDWTTLRTVTGASNAVLFSDTNAPSSRFYRAVTP